VSFLHPLNIDEEKKTKNKTEIVGKTYHPVRSNYQQKDERKWSSKQQNKVVIDLHVVM